MNNVSIYLGSNFLSIANQNLCFWTAIDQSSLTMVEISQGSDLWFWESTSYKSLSALQMVFWMEAPRSCCSGAWQRPLQNVESEFAFLFLAFCCLLDGLKLVMCRGLGSNTEDQSCPNGLWLYLADLLFSLIVKATNIYWDSTLCMTFG